MGLTLVINTSQADKRVDFSLEGREEEEEEIRNGSVGPDCCVKSHTKRRPRNRGNELIYRFPLLIFHDSFTSNCVIYNVVAEISC